MPYEFKRYRVKAIAAFGFENIKIYEKDFRSLDQAIKCLAGFSKDHVSFSLEDRYLERFLDVTDIVDQFRGE